MARSPQRQGGGPSGGSSGQFLWDLLTFDKLITGSVVHLVYWSGLGIIGIGAFGVFGATVGVAIRDFSFFGLLLAIGVLGVGSLGVVAVVLLWRSFCEFYVTIFKISEDLAVLRQDVESERARQGR